MTGLVLRRVFRHVRYILGATGVAFTVLSAALLLPNLSIIIQVVFSGSVSFGTKISFVVSLYGSLFTNFTLLSAFFVVLTAVFFGINIALLTYYIRRRQIKNHNTTHHLSSIGGLLSAALGIGCVACGSVVLTSVFGLFGAGGLLLLLPFNGAEFGMLGILLLLFSIYYLIRKIQDPIVCPIKNQEPRP
ncbi:MAG: uncharacterized membrane protein YjfL (UPF0719 family) [Candidatus Paceibacteria bacterium]|jgi:uncharacterized membrane protein YjfL (UPF0719 family)